MGRWAAPGGRGGAVMLGLALLALVGCGPVADELGWSDDSPRRPGSPGPSEPPVPEPPRPPPTPTPARLAAAEAGLAPLSSARAPRPKREVVSTRALVQLGKALFWDVAVGSDGKTACATCHFAGGADGRLSNVVHPGPNGAFETEGITGPGLTLGSFPRLLSDDRIGSPGVPAAIFVASSPTGADQCVPLDDPTFGGLRQVTGRNAGSVIGAALYREQFWDGRGAHTFNGGDAFGVSGNAGEPVGAPLSGASLASQAVGPALNPEEMSCAERPFNGAGGLGARLLDRPVLAGQQVADTDSVLGPLSAWPDPGLRCGSGPCTYRELVEEAFGPAAAAGAEGTFSRQFGLAVAAYEETLIPDDTPFDRWLAGDDRALSDEQQLGVEVFVGKAGCVACHAGPELTDASETFYRQQGPIGEFGNDTGYHNLGVRPTEEDLGRADTGPGGVSYSVSGSPLDRGAFKTPGLRNVALTPPYFHNGGSPTLQAVMNFYDRGGDHENPERSPRMEMLGLAPDEFGALLDLLANGLTDCRVEMRQAPFDHPSIDIAGGPSLPAVGREGLGPCP